MDEAYHKSDLFVNNNSTINFHAKCEAVGVRPIRGQALISMLQKCSKEFICLF